MPGRLEGKVAVITGAASGIGRESARRFSEEGASVCVADLDTETGKQTAGEVDGFYIHVNVAEPESVQEMYREAADRFGGIDVLFNNAGISPPDDASVLDTDFGVWQKVQDVNLKSVYLCCKYGIPHLLERGSGSVINTASFVGDDGCRHLPGLLHRLEGRRSLHEPRARGTVRPPGRAGKRPQPRTRKYAAVARVVCQRPRKGRPPARTFADGTLRRSDRNSQRRALSRLRRVVLHNGLQLPWLTVGSPERTLHRSRRCIHDPRTIQQRTWTLSGIRRSWRSKVSTASWSTSTPPAPSKRASRST